MTNRHTSTDATEWQDVSFVPCACCEHDDLPEGVYASAVVTRPEPTIASPYMTPPASPVAFASWIHQIALSAAATEGDAPLGDHIETLIAHLSAVMTGSESMRLDLLPQQAD